MKYENKRNGKLVELVNMDEKFKTVELREAGQDKTFTCTTSTFKRWYKKVQEQEVVQPATPESVEEEDVSVAESVAQATTPLTGDVVEKETPKAKPEKKERAKKGMLPDIQALHEYILHTCEELGGNVFVPATDINFRGLKAGKSNFIKYNWSNKSVTLFAKHKALGLDAPLTPVNHAFDDRYTFREDTPENRAEIYRIMKTTYDWQASKNKSKEK